MSLEIGTIVDGKVTGLSKFGAFVALPEGKTGMVHISEISTAYVKEISDFIKVDQEVRVKILGIDERGRISLSIRQAAMDGEEPRKKVSFEDMLSKFMQDSNDKISDLKVLGEGGVRRRGVGTGFKKSGGRHE